MTKQSDRKKKISIVGSGNAGCLTAIQYYLTASKYIDKITIYHDPTIPIERVGQGSNAGVATLIDHFFYLDFYDRNIIKSTRKEGILYENWGKHTDKIFHPFPQSQLANHYIPSLFSKAVLESGVFDVVEKRVENPEEEIDSDFIFDCRGRNNREKSSYDPLINPLNSVILARKEKIYTDLVYTRTVATPNGWTFVIPNIDSTSYGYLYNDQITTKEEAEKDFVERFDVVPDGYLKFENYIAKSCFQGERTILNGNRLSFLEPLEATSTSFYTYVASTSLEHIISGIDKELCNQRVRSWMNKLQNFILWHYQFGSKFDTPFWDYAKSLPFNPEPEFQKTLEYAMSNSYGEMIRSIYKSNGMDENEYSEWSPLSFKNWTDGMGLTVPPKYC